MNETSENTMPCALETVEENDTNNGNRLYKIIRGVLKKELIKRLENRSDLFPISNRISLYYIDFYIIKKCYFNESASTQKAIVLSTKALHRKEIRRIQKAIRTIEDNINGILPEPISSSLLEKITRYVIYQWLKKEFYISKEEIRRFVYGFSVFYSELHPKNTSK